jgi:hypothetical protein
MTVGQPATIEEFLAQQAREREIAKTKNNYFVYGLLFGLLILGLPLGFVLHKSTETGQEVIGTVKQIAAQRDACQARFSRSTLLLDTAGAASQRIHLLNGLIDVAPGTVLGGEQPHPAWFIPADVKPIFYGDVTRAEVVSIDNGRITGRGMPFTLQQVQANPSLLAVQQ